MPLLALEAYVIVMGTSQINFNVCMRMRALHTRRLPAQ